MYKINLFILITLLSLQHTSAEVFVNSFNSGEVANSICIAYNNAPRDKIAVSGGGSAVPTSDIGNQPILQQIDFFVGSILSETKVANLTTFCSEISNQAKAIAAVKAYAFKALSAITTACGGDTPCTLARAKERTSQQIIDELAANTDNPHAREIAKEFLAIQNPDFEEAAQKQKDLYKLSDDCQKEMEKYRYITATCRAAFAVGAYPAEIIRQGVQAAELRVGAEQGRIQALSDHSGGLQPTRVCQATKSGQKPSTVDALTTDCLYYKELPIFLTEESVKNIVALPYNQAFSASGILGPDGGLANISTRVREGNLFDKDMTQNFGSESGQTAGSPTGGSGDVLGNLDTGGTVGELKNAEANYKKLIANTDVIINLYEAAKLAYSSSTSVCVKVPVVSKAKTINEISAAQKPFKDYKAVIKAAWDDAIKKPTKNHVSLINTINTDLRDKMNQDLIDKVLAAVKALLGACVSGTSVTTS